MFGEFAGRLQQAEQQKNINVWPMAGGAANPNPKALSKKTLKKLHTDGTADTLFVRYGEIQNS